MGVAMLAACASQQGITVLESGPPGNSCDQANTLTSETIGKKETHHGVCLPGVGFVDREGVLIFPFSRPGETRKWDIVIFPDEDLAYLRRTLEPLNGQMVMLRGDLEADEDCWHKSRVEPDEQMICLPASRPVRFSRGAIWPLQIR